MKLCFTILLVALGFTQIHAEAQELPDQYKPFQGRWKQTPPPDSPETESAAPEVLVDVVGRSFVLHGNGVTERYRRVYEYRVPGPDETQPYQYLHEQGIGKLAGLVDLPNQITVFWWVGLYRFHNNRLELRLKYCGQGVEGDAAREFRPPSSFDPHPPKDVARIFLEKVPVDNAALLTEDQTGG